MKPGARPARALPVGAQIHFSWPKWDNGLEVLSVLQNGGDKRRLSGAGRT